MNAKLGGINAVLDNSPLNDPNQPTIVLGMTKKANFWLEIDFRVHFTGADVIHPAPGAEGRPSFTGLVSSVDRHTAKYVAISKVQTGRQEIIGDLEEMVNYALTKFLSYRKMVEKADGSVSRLIFYRGNLISNHHNVFCQVPDRFQDGVSEGQFKTVLDEGKLFGFCGLN